MDPWENTFTHRYLTHTRAISVEMFEKLVAMPSNWASHTSSSSSWWSASESWSLHTSIQSAHLAQSSLSHLPSSSVQFSHSVVSDSLQPHNRSTPGLPVYHQLPESTQIMFIESVMPSNHLILCRPLLLLPSIFPSIRVCSNEFLHIRWPKYWSIPSRHSLNADNH